MLHKIYNILLGILFITIPFKTTAQNWTSSPCSGLQLRTAVYCPSEGNFMRMWGEIFEYPNKDIPTITQIIDLNGKTYNRNDTLKPTSDITIIIHSTLNANNCIDTVKIIVAPLPQAKITSGLPEPLLCINSYIDEPQVDTQNTDVFRWEKVAIPVEEISFPFRVTENMNIRLAYANSTCGSGLNYIDIALKVADTIPLPDLYITKPYQKATPSSNSNFVYITDICHSCYFPLPQAKELKVDSGTIVSASIYWFMPDTPAHQDTTRYGFATITLRGDSNICGYKSRTFTEQPVQVDIKTYSCDPVIYFGDLEMLNQDTICPCGDYYFGVRKPNGANAAARCFYTEDDITGSIIPDPSKINNSSLGSYDFKPTDTFKAYVTVNAELQCPAGAYKEKVSVTLSDSIEVSIDDKKCPIPVDYHFCKSDTGYIFFTHNNEKHIINVEFFPPHKDLFIGDPLRSDNRNIVYKSIDTVYSINGSGFWDTVHYTVTYFRNNCNDTASYDTFTILKSNGYCEPIIKTSSVRCAGSQISISVQEISRAVVIDSFVIKDSADFYILKLEKDTCITTYSDIGNFWDHDISGYIEHTLIPYTKNKQDYAYLNVPLTVYWRDTIDPYWHDSVKTTKFTIQNYIYDCIDLERYLPTCVGQKNIYINQRKVNFATIKVDNPNTNINNVKISFDSTSPFTNAKANASKFIFETVQFANSVSYKIDINYNINDSIRYKQFSFPCNISDCAPYLVASKDTICSGDSISIKVVNNNIDDANVRIHHVVWDSFTGRHIDSIKSEQAKWSVKNGYRTRDAEAYTLYNANIYAPSNIITADIYLAVNTVYGYDTLIMYRDSFEVFINPKPNIFAQDTIYICRDSTINLHDYEEYSTLIIPPNPTYELGERDPASFAVSDPGNIKADALCKYHCDNMTSGSNMFQDNIYIDIDRGIQIISQGEDKYACVNDVVLLFLESNGRTATWITNGIDTLAKNVPIRQNIYDTVKNVSKQYTAIISNSCGTEIQNFSIHPNILPEVTMPPDIEICAGNVIKIAPVFCNNCNTCLWSGFGQSSTAWKIDLPLDENSIAGYLTFTAFTDSNCKQSDSIFINPLPFAPVKIQADGKIADDSINVCFNNSTSFSASYSIKQPEYTDEVIASWSEYPQSSKVSINANEIAIDSADNYAQGLYIYTTDLNGCFASDSVFVKILPLPQISISGLGFVCTGDTALLTGVSPHADYLQWHGSNNHNNILAITEAGKYFVDAYMNGCVSTANIDITSRQKPSFSIGQDTVICNHEIVILSAPYHIYSNFWWQDNSKEDNYTVTTTGDYYVTAEKDSCYNTDNVFVEVLYCGALRFPNAFTPNGDNLNDQFIPANSVEKNNLIYEFLIYNRLGECVFSTTNPEEGWDGTFKGKACEPAVYLYRCTANIIFPARDVSTSGTVTLIR